MVQNSIIVAATAPLPHNFHGSLPSHIISSWTGSVTSVSPTGIPTIVLHTDHFITSSLLPCADKNVVPSPPSSSPPPTDIRHSSNTWSPLIKLLLFWRDMDFFKDQVIAEGSENRSSTPPLYQAKGAPQHSFNLDLRHVLGY